MNAEQAKKALRDLKAWKEGISHWKDGINEDIFDLKEENEELHDRIEALESRLDVVEEGSTTKEGKISQIVEQAQNYRSGDQPAVVMDAERIVGATGVSRRYAYDLIDDLPQEFHWILTRSEATDRQFASVEIDHSKQKKSIVIDFEALHSDTEALNKFTTQPNGGGN